MVNVKVRVLTRFLGRAFLGGQQVDLLSWFCFVSCLLLPFFLLYSQLFRGGIVPWPHPCRTLVKNRERFKGKTYFFKECYVSVTKHQQNQDRFKIKIFFRNMFLGPKFTKLDRFKVVNFLFHYLIKYRIDQMLFQSNVVLFKYHFNQVLFQPSVV